MNYYHIIIFLNYCHTLFSIEDCNKSVDVEIVCDQFLNLMKIAAMSESRDCRNCVLFLQCSPACCQIIAKKLVIFTSIIILFDEILSGYIFTINICLLVSMLKYLYMLYLFILIGLSNIKIMLGNKSRLTIRPNIHLSVNMGDVTLPCNC